MFIGLGLSLTRLRGGAAFTPASLFANGEAGAWYNPDSDTVAGALPDISGNGFNLAQATGGNQPSVGSDGSAYFVGLDGNDFMTASASISQTSGTIALAFRPGAVVYQSGRRCILSFSDTGTANNWLEVGLDIERRLYVEFNSGGALTTHRTTSAFEPGSDYSAIIVYDGADVFVSINGQQDPIIETFASGAGGWFGDVSGGDTLTLGAANSSAGVSRHFTGRIYSALFVETEAF